MSVIREFQTYYNSGYKEALPRELIENHNILECLSSAAECDTLLVKQKDSGKKVVAKCYTRSSPQYDMEEPTQLGIAENKAIPQYIGEYKNEEYRCVLREYIEGTSLDEYVSAKSLSQDDLTELAIGLANAMKVLHEGEPAIIHRDIKPENIIIKEDGTIALIDLGISRIFKKDKDADTVFCGTEKFAPPEQYGFMQTDIRSDIYSFGIVLSWLLTGEAKPMQKPTTKLERVAAKCCEFSPDKRYRDDRALLRDLHRATDRYRRRRLKGIIAAAVLFLVLAAGMLAAGIEYRQSLQDGAYVFREPLIEEAVRVVLDRPEGIITAADLEAVTGIYIQGEQAYKDRDTFYNVGSQWYYIGERIRGSVTELSDLKNMPNLEWLCIGGNHIRDLSPLKNLEHLRGVELRDNDIRDLSPLAGHKTLESVLLLANPLTGIETITTWPMLNELDLRDTEGYDAAPIGKLKIMNYLDICNDTDAWQYLDGLQVQHLAIKAWGQNDLECLRNVAYIEELDLTGAQVEDISALEGREDIVYLNLEQCVTGDLSPLFTMPNLATVEMSIRGREQMEELISIYGKPTFEIIYNF